MDLQWLQTFISAAESENFRETAERLYLTQPAVSQHMRKLENELDMQLFLHSGRRVVLTDEGRLFLPYAKEIINAYQAGKHKVSQWNPGVQPGTYAGRTPLHRVLYIASLSARLYPKTSACRAFNSCS